MEEQPTQSRSVPPPIAANPAAARYVASLAPTAEPEAPSEGHDRRTLSETLVPLAGMYFVCMGIYRAVLLLENIPKVTSTPQPDGPNTIGSSGWSVASGTYGPWWLLGALIAIASIYAGVRILYSDGRGHGVGVLLALSGLAFSFVDYTHAHDSAAIGFMAVDVFLLWVLLASRTFGSR